MLDKTDIKSIISSGEGYNAEFKVRVPKKLKDITEEVCALANAAGGVVLIGVDDNNQIIGTDIDNSKRSAIQNSLNEINPYLHCPLYEVKVDTKNIWVIEVASGSQKPYTLSGAIYVRQGPNSQKLTSVEQMRDFFQQSNRIFFDEAPCSGFDLNKDFDSTWFEEFRLEAGLSKTISQEQIINNLKLILPDHNIKNGAVLFFGAAPEQFIETAVIRCIAFDGSNKTQIIDDKIFGGPLIKQYQQAMQWLKGKLNVRYEIEGAGPRKEIWEIPETAFKEAIINALSHRDYYDKGAKITIELFDDRVEISNPGGLTSAISPAEFGTKSHSRNPLIFGLFVRIHMVEQVGSGISRITDLLKKAKLPKPVFKTKGMFTVTFKRTKGSQESSQESSQENLNKTSKEILKLVKNKKDITTAEMANKLNMSRRAIAKHISKLKENGIITRIGSTKSGFWKIL